MPTYDYRCDSCDHQFEEFQSMMDKHLRKCPQCGKLKLRRLLGTGAAILFKGSGFYQTDYRSESYKSAAKAEEAKPAASPSTGQSLVPTPGQPASSSGNSASVEAKDGGGGGKKPKSSS